METVFALLKNWSVTTFWLGSAYAVFFYLGHFTVAQSVLLALVGLMAVNGYRLGLKVAEKQPPEFEPFWISIEPNWYLLSKDFDLTDVGKWEELLKKCRIDSAKYGIFRHGIAFTVLSPTLFYSNNHQSFFGELDIKEKVEELAPEEADRFSLEPFAPCFYVKRLLTGPKRNCLVFEFGLVTQESLKRSIHPADDAANIIVAQLPEVVFSTYYNSGPYDPARERMVGSRIAASLSEYGWTQKERDPEESWHWPSELEHKYVRVYYRGIRD